MTQSNNSLDYRQAGVDTETADAFVDSIKSMSEHTQRPGVLAGIGGFASLFEIPAGYQQPVLVSGTDGVGTKLKLATALNKHDTIGIDLVAMCVNDVLTQGAEPLFFLDYFATGKLNPIQAKSILSGIVKGCELSNSALVGGETAEMPGMYQGDDYDLAGFSVGIVEKSKIIDGSKVKAGDALIALASSGVHSNGFSLVRKVIETRGLSLNQAFANSTLGESLLTPTRIYVKSILALLEKVKVHAMVHITGGGMLENIPRVLPAHLQAVIDTKTWQRPTLFDYLQEQAGISNTEMYRTFNMGVGFIIGLAKTDVESALKFLKEAGENAWLVGLVEESAEKSPHVVIA